jgi:hypothetical protein
MKKLFIAALIVLFMAVPSFGMDLTFQWDESPEPDVVSYSIYISAISGTYTPADLITPGTANCVAGICTSTATDIGSGTWYCVVTATDDLGFESDYSNEVNTASPGVVVNFAITIVVP